MNYYLDLDGTLIDSTKRHGVLLNDILNKKNIKIVDENELFHYKASGYSTYTYLTKIKKVNENIANEIVKEWQKKIEKEQYLEYDVLYDDTIEFLEKIFNNKNNNIYFLTARQNKKNIIKEVEKFGIIKYTKKMFIVSPVNAVEEKKQIILNSQKNFNTIIFGDTEVDYQVAEQLNIDYFILNRGFRNKHYWDSKNVKSHKTLMNYKEKK